MTKNAQLIKKLADRGQHGRSRTPSDFYMSEDYSDYYWSGCTFSVDFETWKKAARILNRYHRMMRYIDSISWENVGGTVSYADNSIEQRQVNKFTGKFRNVMVTAPSGDLCF